MSDVASVTRAQMRGMITLRGDLSSRAMRKAVKAATGCGVPVSGQFLGDASKGVAWMSPDELLVIVPYGDVAATLIALDKALKGKHYLTADVSDARAVFRVSGPNARAILARLCPVDLHADSFKPGDFRRTRLAQIAAAFWMHDAGFDVVCFRSVADYADGVLRNAAKGAPIGMFSP